MSWLYASFHLSEPTTEVSPHSAGYEEVLRVGPFNATDKLGPDVRELLSMHCSWCVLDCGEAQIKQVIISEKEYKTDQWKDKIGAAIEEINT